MTGRILIADDDPDIALVQQKVADVIARAEGRAPSTETAEAAPEPEAPATPSSFPSATPPAEPSSTPSSTPTPAQVPTPTPTPTTPPSVTGGSLGSLSQGYAANQSEDLGAVC